MGEFDDQLAVDAIEGLIGIGAAYACRSSSPNGRMGPTQLYTKIVIEG